RRVRRPATPPESWAHRDRGERACGPDRGGDRHPLPGQRPHPRRGRRRLRPADSHATRRGGMAALMIQGTSSWAGKSLLTTALCRSLARRGLRVAPFKAQNMSNNARVVEGGEIGAAQYMQALAAGVEPDVRMNPVLIKPESGGRSEVVVLGKRDAEVSRLPWHLRSDRTWTEIERAMIELAAEHDVLLIEGAGSPAEPNLHDRDVANMRTAKAAGARVFVVADVERGGAFAHLYGTWLLLDVDERAHVSGFVLNRSHGDPA